jgi:hypothetical protein
VARARQRAGAALAARCLDAWAGRASRRALLGALLLRAVGALARRRLGAALRAWRGFAGGRACVRAALLGAVGRMARLRMGRALAAWRVRAAGGVGGG